MKTKTLSAVLMLTASSVQASSLDETLARCAPNIDPSTMRSILTVESSVNPYAIGVDTPGLRLERQPRTAEEAIATARWLHDNGYRYGAGWAQISHANFDRLGLTPETVFDPCLNLQAAQKVLVDDYQIAKNSPQADKVSPLLITLSRYNTGDNERGFRNGYVNKVVAAAGGKKVAPIALVPTGNKAKRATAKVRHAVPNATEARIERLRREARREPASDVFANTNATNIFSTASAEQDSGGAATDVFNVQTADVQ